MDKTIVDCHAHACLFSGDDEGNIFRPPLMKRWLPGYLKKRCGIPRDDPSPNDTYLALLAREISESDYAQKAVVLASDGIYDERGELDASRTCFLITNDYVCKKTGSYGELLFGASINPARKDALNELERCREHGAVLNKVLPNIQHFDPGEQRYVPFFRKMAELNMPLLAHAGYEFTLPGANQELGDPARLRTALEAGVTVIIAHAGSTGLPFGEKYFGTVQRLVATYPRVYLDTSALTLPSRAPMLFKLRRCDKLLQRCIFGTDYPLPSYVFPYAFSLPRGKLKEITGVKNYFDRQILLFKALGINLSETAGSSLFT